MEMHGIVWAYILVLILKNLDISRFMEIYRITKPGVYLTMPNFIYPHNSFIFKGSGGLPPALSVFFAAVLRPLAAYYSTGIPVSQYQFGGFPHETSSRRR